MCPLSRTISKKIFSNIQFYREGKLNVRRHISQNLCTLAPAERFKSFVPFDEMMEQRRDEAGRSIVVQIKSMKSCNDLLSYCLKFGAVKNAFYYNTDHQSNYVIVEYNSYESCRAAINYASISNCKEVIPTSSPFLWLRADFNQGEIRTDLPHLQVENNSLPSSDELQKALSESSSFSDGIMVLYNRLKLTETGYRRRYITALQIEAALKGMFTNGRVIPFGSSANNFGKVNCDLDLVLELNSLTELPETSRLRMHAKPMDKHQHSRHLEITADIIQYFLPGCNNIRRIFRARVPIVKYLQELTGIECDLSSTNMSGVFMSEWLYLCSSYDQRVCPLVFAVRYWAKELKLTHSTPGKWITNFSLTLLTLFFLQCEKIIPTLDLLTRLRRAQDDKLIDDVNCGFLKDLRLLTEMDTKPNNGDLFTLLFKFFEFYASFESRSYALSLNSGSMIPKPVYYPLYIVNPLEKGLNVSRNVSAEELERFKLECRNAMWIIECSIGEHSKSATKWGFLDMVRAQMLNRSNFRQNVGMKNTTRFNVQNLFEKDHEVKC